VYIIKILYASRESRIERVYRRTVEGFIVKTTSTKILYCTIERYLKLGEIVFNLLQVRVPVILFAHCGFELLLGHYSTIKCTLELTLLLLYQVEPSLSGTAYCIFYEECIPTLNSKYFIRRKFYCTTETLAKLTFVLCIFYL
jgi:hypothetical protein